MNEVAAAQQAPATSSTQMIATLGGVAAMAGFLVVLVFQLTKPIIAENQRIAIERAVFQVVPGASQRRDYLVRDDGVVPAEQGGEGIPVYAAFDAEGNLEGVAAKAGAVGYADMIHLLYGFDPACECVRGIKVLKLAETPGLGDKIITDANFVANFDALDARLNEAGDALANAIVTVKSGSKANPWEIDAISGATVSSVAVGKAVNQSAQALLPKLMPYVDQLQPPPQARIDETPMAEAR